MVTYGNFLRTFRAPPKNSANPFETLLSWFHEFLSWTSAHSWKTSVNKSWHFGISLNRLLSWLWSLWNISHKFGTRRTLLVDSWSSNWWKLSSNCLFHNYKIRLTVRLFVRRVERIDTIIADLIIRAILEKKTLR